MTPLTTFEVGAELARYMKATEGTGGDADHYRALVSLMMDASCRSPADALALVSWIAAVLPIAANSMPPDEHEFGGPRALISTAATMARRAAEGLEASTGISSEAFIGSQTPAH